MEIIFTKDAELLRKWDAFVMAEDKASHLMLAQWNASFSSYGFDCEIGMLFENGTVRGGFCAIIAKALAFRFYVVPFGPVVSEGFESQLDALIAKVPERAKANKCCYAHITLPFSLTPNQHVYNALPPLPALDGAKPGHLFKYVYSGYGLNWIDLKGFDEESKINTLKPSVRRNIRNSYRKDLVFAHLDSDEAIAQGYQLFLENAKAANYVIRDWNDMRETLFALRKAEALKMLGAYKNGELKGAILLLQSGNYFTYILGGSKKEVPDLRTGDFLQWEAVKLSLEHRFDGYNISLGGSKGVIEFKNSFNTEQVLFENSKYHWVLEPGIFKAYLFFENKLKPYKKPISKLLSVLKKKK